MAFWLFFLLSIIFTKFIHITAYITSSFLLPKIFHYMVMLHLIYAFISWYIFGLFKLFNYYELFLWGYIYISIEYILKSEMLDHMVTLCLTFWETARLLSKVGVPFFIPICNEFCLFRNFSISSGLSNLLACRCCS